MSVALIESFINSGMSTRAINLALRSVDLLHQTGVGQSFARSARKRVRSFLGSSSKRRNLPSLRSSNKFMRRGRFNPFQR